MKESELTEVIKLLAETQAQQGEVLRDVRDLLARGPMSQPDIDIATINAKRGAMGREKLVVDLTPHTQRRAICIDRETETTFDATLVVKPRAHDARLRAWHVVAIENAVFVKLRPQLVAEIQKGFDRDDAARTDAVTRAAIDLEKKRLIEHAIWSRAWLPLLRRYVTTLPDGIVAVPDLDRLAIWHWEDEESVTAATEARP